MSTVYLGNDLRIQRIITGKKKDWKWTLIHLAGGHSDVDIEECADLMKKYIDIGWTTFDMADHYGPAEEVVGRFREKYGNVDGQFFTKWVPPPSQMTREGVEKAVVKAMDRMRTARIDLLQIHWWQYANLEYITLLKHLTDICKQGGIRYLGLTNFDTIHLKAIVHRGFKVVSNQVSFSIVDRRALANGMCSFCEENGVKVLAYGTLLGGFLTEKWLGVPEPKIDELPNWSLKKYARFINAAGGWDPFQRVLAVLSKIAQRHSVGIANVATKFILDTPGVGGVIVGARLTKSNDHIESNAQTLNLVLSDKDTAEINRAIDEHLCPVPNDVGDEYRKPPYLTAAGDLSHHATTEAIEEHEEGGVLKLSSGTVWEDIAGFSRAVRVGNQVFVSGTTATGPDGSAIGKDPEIQTHVALDKIEHAIRRAGGSGGLEHVVRTRVYVRDVDRDWEAVARAHGARFNTVRPANTLVGAPLVGEEYFVEIEADAIIL
ncbi:aldo/keto reductase [Cladochytrium replicatum]|nr:aldo/keto reductase [Cladochytrium replicatum]